MPSIDLETLLTSVYVLVDDDCQEVLGHPPVKVGAKTDLSESEVLTLMVAHDFLPYAGERQYLAYLRANHGDLFPELLTQSQYNRRVRALGAALERLRQHWVIALVGDGVEMLLLDTKPIPVMGLTRSKSKSDFAGSAAYGYCPARQMDYFGYKLVMLTTLSGVPVVYDLVPANLDERQAAEAVLHRVQGMDILADKGFIGQAWQAQVQHTTHNRLWTPKRRNQAAQNPPDFDRWLKRFRERIETTFHQLQNTGRNLERLLAKTVRGLAIRVAQKVASFVLKLLLRRRFRMDLQSFTYLD